MKSIRTKVSEKNYKLREEMRSKQIKKIINSARFNEDFINHLEEEKQQDRHLQEQSKFDLQEVVKAIDQKNIDELYDRLRCCENYELKMLEGMSKEIIELILENIKSVKSALLLASICQKSTFFIEAMFRFNKCSLLIQQLGELKLGSKEQKFYLYILQQITHQPHLVEIQQIKNIYELIQKIFEYEVQNQRQDTLTIRVLMNLASFCGNLVQGCEIGYSKEMIMLILNKFWTTRNQMNKINIYSTVQRIIEQKYFKKSTELFIAIMNVVTQGREKIQPQYHKSFKSMFRLLALGFQGYNQKFENFDTHFNYSFGCYTQKMTIHNYFLIKKYELFENCPKEEGYNFLYEFSKNGKADIIIQVWDRIGILAQLIQQINDLSSFALISLKIFRNIISQFDSISKVTYFEVLRSHNFIQILNQTLMRSNITELNRIILAILDNSQLAKII